MITADPGTAKAPLMSHRSTSLAAGVLYLLTFVFIPTLFLYDRVKQTRAIAQLAETGQFRPVIDRAFDLTDIAQAHWHVSTGRKRGIVVVRVAVPSTRQSSGETR